MSETAIHIATSPDGQRWVRIIGQGTMRISPALLDCLTQLSDASATDIWIDLSDCHRLDSTVAGCLIGFWKKSQAGEAPRLHLQRPSKPCLDSLHQLNLDKHLSIEEACAPEGLEWVPVQVEQPESSTLSQVLIQAHRDLASSDPGNAEFAQIAEAFERDSKVKRFKG